MNLPDVKPGKSSMENLSRLREPGMLPVTITLVFLCVTAGWILFEHSFLPWSPISKDFLWAILSAGVLYLLLRYGMSVIRKSETALKKSERRLSSILETSASGILMVDPKGYFVYANPEAVALLGMSRSELIGGHYTERHWEITTVDGRPYPAEDLPFSRLARTGEAKHGVEMAVRRLDGSRVILSANTAPLHDPDGDVVGMVASFFDITARREAEDLQLRKLHLAVEQSPSAIAITDAKGRIEYANPMFVRMTGYSREVLLLGMMPFPTEISPPEYEQIRDAIAAGTEWKGEYWNRRGNGERYWESAALTPIRTAEGAAANFLWVAQDVTEERMAEEALRESRERYQNIVENVQDLVWEADQDGVFTYVSPRIRDLLGYDPGEVVGKSPFDLMPEFEASRVRDLITPIMAKGLAFEHIENIFRHRNGAPLFFTSSGMPSCDADGSLRGWRGVSRDITRLKKDEEALRQSEERFRQIFEQNEEAVFLFRSGTAEIVDANPAALSLYGYSREEMRDGGLVLFVSPGEQVLLEQEIRGIEPELPLTVEETHHVRKDGTPIIVSIRGKSIQLKEGKVSYCTFRDITARVRAEEEARVRQAQLVHANRMTSLGTMVSGVAHEINNPNNLIMFNTPMILSAWTGAERVLESYYRESGEFSLGGLPYSEMRYVVPKLIAGISDSSVRIRNIVERLKTFARRDREDLECEVDVNEVSRSAVAILSHEIAKGCANFRLDIGEGLPRVKGCAQQLEQVMINILMNSLQALPDRTKGIRVSTSVDGETDTVQVCVSDEGVGMTPETMRHLTEPFFSTKLDSGGLGLGLSISTSIVEAHNGTLGFTSGLGKGTTARITLPSADSAMDGSHKVSIPKYSR